MKLQLLVVAAASLVVSAQYYNIYQSDISAPPPSTLEVAELTQTYQCYDMTSSTSYTMLLSVDFPKQMTAAVYIAEMNGVYNGVLGLSRIDTPVSIAYVTGERGTMQYCLGGCSLYDLLASVVPGTKEVMGSASVPFGNVPHYLAQHVYELPCQESNGNIQIGLLANYMVTANYSRTVPPCFSINFFSMSDVSEPVVEGIIDNIVCGSCLPGTTCCLARPNSLGGHRPRSDRQNLSIAFADVTLNSAATPPWVPTSSASSSGSKATAAASPGSQAASQTAAKSGGYHAGVSVAFVALSASTALFAAVLFI